MFAAFVIFGICAIIVISDLVFKQFFFLFVRFPLIVIRVIRVIFVISLNALCMS